MAPMKMHGDGRKAKDPKKTVLRLLGYMKQYTANLIAVLALSPVVIRLLREHRAGLRRAR